MIEIKTQWIQQQNERNRGKNQYIYKDRTITTDSI